MRTNFTFICILLLYLLAFFCHALYLKKTVYGDGIFYYSWLRSVVIDRDNDFTDEYSRYGVTQPAAGYGGPGNKYSIGPAILWSPAFLYTHAVVRGDGYGWMYELSAGISSVLYVLFALALLYTMLPGTVPVRTASLLLIAFATNLLYYGALDPVNSHGLSFFAAVLYMASLYRKTKHWHMAGFALGLIAVIRLQDVIYGLLLLPAIGTTFRILPFVQNTAVRAARAAHARKKALRAAAGVASGFVLPFSLQLAAWFAVNRTLINPYILGGEGFHPFRPQIAGVLFSPENGLILWTPAVLMGFIGLLLRKPVSLWMAAVFALEVYAVSSWSTWWQGASVGGRMFVSMLPVAAWGLTGILEKLYRIIRPAWVLYPLLLLPLAAVNILYTIGYLLLH